MKEPDEVSADGLFSYQEVECLGACEFAPMMRFEHRYHYDLTPAKIDTLIAEAKKLLPARGEVAAEKQLLPARGEVAAKPPEGQPRKPRAPRKKKAPDA